MNIVNIASQYFNLKKNSHNTWSLEEHDSVILFEETNTYHRFSNGETGDVYKFLRNIVGLTHDQAKEYYNDSAERKASLLETLRRTQKVQKIDEDSGYEYHEFVGKPGYNQYIESRNISKTIAEFYNLEIDGDDVLFPLYDDNLKRIGSIKRFAHAKHKNDRYRTYILHGYDKPCCWDMRQLVNLTPNQIVVLVEGTWGVMRIKQVVGHLPIVPIATMGTNIKPELFDYINRNRIIAILDDDTGGERYKKQLQMQRNKGKMIQEVTLNNNGKNIYVDDLSDRQILKLFNNLLSEIRLQ